MAATSPTVAFNQDGARRIVRAVRSAERAPAAGGPPRPPPPPDNERFLARLTEASDGGHAWEGVYPQADGTYGVVDGLNSAGEFTARDYDDGKEAAAGAVVWLDFWGYDDDDVPWYRFVTGGRGPRWGKLVAPWDGGNQVTLQPVKNRAGTAYDDPPPTVSPYIIMPITKAPAYLVGDVDDVFAFEDLGDADGTLMLVNPQTTPLPVRAWEVMQASAAGRWAVDYMRGHDV